MAEVTEYLINGSREVVKLVVMLNQHGCKNVDWAAGSISGKFFCNTEDLRDSVSRDSKQTKAEPKTGQIHGG